MEINIAGLLQAKIIIIKLLIQIASNSKRQQEIFLLFIGKKLLK